MSYLYGYYSPPHLCQFDYTSFDAANGCVWTSTAMGINAATGGQIARTPTQIHSLVSRWEETSPLSAGWSIPDQQLACGRLGVGFANHTGQGWASLVASLDSGHYVVLQGISSVFGNSTCSGAFNGAHEIGIQPAKASGKRWIDDPICQQGRWEYETVIRAYGARLDPNMRFGVFTKPLPRQAGAPPLGPIPYGAQGWYSFAAVHQLWTPSGIPRVLRPVYSSTGSFTFRGWVGPLISKSWAPGARSLVVRTDKFRQILGSPHYGLWYRVSDMGETWHPLP